MGAPGQLLQRSFAWETSPERNRLRPRPVASSASPGTWEVERDPVIAASGPLREFEVTLSDRRRVIGDDRHGEWAVYVYAPNGEFLGYGAAVTRLSALEHAGLTDDDTGEVLGRSGI